MKTRHAVRFGLEIVLLSAFLSAITSAIGFADDKDPMRYVSGPHLDFHDPAALFFARAQAFRERRSEAGLPGAPGVDMPLEGTNEMTSAVNPLNPLHIAYASLWELRVSLDGGLTWGDIVLPKVPQTHIAFGDPGLAFDANGRLFWLYLAAPRRGFFFFAGCDVLIAQCDPLNGEIMPGYPINVTGSIGLPGSAGNFHDKGWLAVDSNPASPFANRLYLTWTLFPPGNLGTRVLSTYSADQGLTWSPAAVLEASSPTFKWPVHNQVAPNGDYFVAYHRQPTFVGGAPNGTSGTILVKRSTDGGVTFPQSISAFPTGQADMTFNVQSLVNGVIPATDFWLQGSVQPWIITDPNVPGRMYVVANDDPDNNVNTGDPANVYIARSTDSGLTWSAPVRVDHGPGTTFQVMPTASIDPASGAIVVHYYDNRNGAVNADGNFLLDVYATVSVDGGQSFLPDFQVNDEPFDPDAGARCRWDCGAFVNDVWTGGGTAFAVTDANHLLTGNPWSVVGSTDAPMFAVWGTSPTNVYMCGPSGRIRRFDGSQVFFETSNTVNDLYAMDGRAANDIFAVGANGTIAHYNGGSWSATQFGIEELHDVWANPTGDVWAVGSSTVLRYNGVSWQPFAGPSGTPELGIVWGSSDSNVYITAWNENGVYHWNNGEWDFEELGFLPLGVWGSSANDVIVTGFARIAHFNGSTWVREDISEHVQVRLHGTGPNNVFVAGEDAFIAHYDGDHWSRQPFQVMPLNSSERIGEYNGVAAGGGRSYAVWCGNTQEQKAIGGAARDQQAIFDSFDTAWQMGISIVDASVRVPGVILERVRPNPTRGSATVTYALPKPTDVDLALVDVQGRRVATLIHGKQPAGRHIVSWDEEQHGGRAVPAGIYFLQLRAGTETRTERLTLLH